MPNRRILIVDDSVVIRRALTDALSHQPGLDVVGSAPNGRIALMKIPLLRPDVVALDFEMPEMNGLETLGAIRQSYPALSVIMLNVPTPEGAAATVEALTRGASDYVMKPEGVVPSEEALKLFCHALVSKVVAHRVGDESRASPAREPQALTSGPRRLSTSRADVVAIGVSTGGPSALMDLITTFPADFPVPILIVQHMPPMFTKLLADRLTAKSSIPVAEGRPSETLQPGHAWIAPGDFHMAVERHGEGIRIVTHQQPPENSCRPAADVLFRSIARVFGPHVLAVVMTGMGQDGLKGCEAIQAAGGQVLVQDERSSVVWGMPGFVARAGIADDVLPLDQLGPEIIARVWRHRLNPHVAV